MTETLTRFFLIEEALRAGRPRPDSTGTRFAAAALLPSSRTATQCNEATRSRYEALTSGLSGGGWFSSSAPSGNLRWVYAAILAANDIPAERFLDARGQLREQAKREAGPRLHAGGARAALVLSISGELSSYTMRRFFELKRALDPPWWRRNDAVTDTFAAGHAARDDAPESVKRARDASIAVFADNKHARSHKREGARLSALLDRDPHKVLACFDTLETARRTSAYLKHRSDRSLTMEWAVQGMTREDLAAIKDIMQALPRHMTSAGHAKARLAYLVHTTGGADLPLGSVNALSAVLAAQAAMIAAITASTTAATSAAVTSGS